MKPKEVIIVGGGLTGSILSCLLKRKFKENVNINVWEKSRGCGGRMSTSRCEKSPSLTLDLGAQYISATPEYFARHENYYKELLEANVLSPLVASIDGMKHIDVGTKHFVASNGSSSIPKYFMEQAGNPLNPSTTLKALDVQHGMVKAHGMSRDASISRDADAIILTIPIPQLFALQGDIKKLLITYKEKLDNVQYSSRYALGLFYPNLNEIPDVDWSGKYVTDNPCLRYISIDTKKRQKQGTGTSVVVHTSVPFGIKYLDDSFKKVQSIIEEELFKYMPSLPNTELKKILRWRYSQVSRSYEGIPGYLLLNKKPFIALAGDAFVHSNFDGCIESAHALLDAFNMYHETDQ